MAVRIEKKIKGYSVVNPDSPPTQPVNFVTNEADRRLKLDAVQTPVAKSLRWQHRPRIVEGNDARVFEIRSPDYKFYVVVSYVRNGSAYPFEVLVAGNAPRGLNVLAKSISMDMRSNDRGFLKRKLEAIAKTEGNAFDMTMPNGVEVSVPSVVAAFARLVHYQCEQLGAFSEENLAKETSLLDAMMSKRPPKTTPDGGVAWYCDIHNQQTGDKFKLFLPELELVNGKKRPYEIWFDGVFPLESFRGLAKSLSLDLQVNCDDWARRKVRQLNISENKGDFWATIPGSDKSKSYPSTWAYIAAVMLYRFQKLGLLDEEGNVGNSNVVLIHRDGEKPAPKAKQKKLSMLDCVSCGAKEAVKVDGGCATCCQCSYSTCG